MIARDIGESIHRSLDEYRRSMPVAELIENIKDLESMLDAELSDLDRSCVLEELQDCREELARRTATTVGTA